MQNAITIGTKVKLIHMDDPYPIEPNTIGIVEAIDDMNQIHVAWENGRHLALVPGVDKYIILD